MEAPHSRLLSAAAKAHLAPIGLLRKGRSRTWIADHGWYLIVVEFQPSGFSKGSYLNVGAHFLWQWSGSLSFDLGYRVDQFVRYNSDAQFQIESERLAIHAVTEIQRLRDQLPGPGAVPSALPPDPEGMAGWPTYHRAVSLGLTGETDDASRLFQGLLEPSENYEWIVARAKKCQGLLKLLFDRPAFQDAIMQLIKGQRQALRLPSIPDPFM